MEHNYIIPCDPELLFNNISKNFKAEQIIFKCGIETYHTLLPEGLNYMIGTMTKFC